MASPGGSNSSTAMTSSGLKSEQSSEQQIITPTSTRTNRTNNGNRNKKRSRQTLLSSSSSGGCDNSSSGVSSLESVPTDGTVQPEMQTLMEQRRKRRKESNRDSARRSRMRKQLHTNGMEAQVANLRAENYKMLVMLEGATAGFLTMESENAVLRTQAIELQSRLRSLNDIIKCMHMNMTMNVDVAAGDMMMNNNGGFGALPGSWGMGQMPIMPSLDLYQCM